MRVMLMAVLLAGLLGASDGRVPVVVELFTSEGCSSCPAADRLLASLDQSQPVAGARIIALEEHVDYWNQLGWIDPFSAPQYRFRQNDYAQLFGVTSVFTPQMVVGGQAGFVGSDSTSAQREIAKVLGRPMADVDLRLTPNAKDPSMLDLHVLVRNIAALQEDSDILLAVTEARLSSEVKRGENAGKVLVHAPVVRSFGVIGKVQPRKQSEVNLMPTLQLPKQWNRDNLRAVVFLQEQKTRKVTGAATLDLR